MMKIRLFEIVRSLFLFGVLLLLSIATAAAEEVVDIYAQEVPKMTTLECAKCHVQVFTDLRDNGGLHKQECRECHDKFHTFTPGVAWEDRVPSCTGCHEYPHGEDMNACLECHQNAHAPIESLVVAGKLAELCVKCHQEPQTELQQPGNVHGGQECGDCHQGARHGSLPNCSECHDGAHTAYVDNAGCTACHPPHEPNRINYGTDIANDICAGCHVDQFEVLQASEKKHSLLACVVCHAKEHGSITTCQQCHGNGPHNPTLLENFEKCGDCHGDPHRLKL
ncbi:cytochrome c3 family protein [Malonomonas rubra]|uniref:cytochrome c3 family protein n=1 Tax=Malonomonas rubra TaxID=57040 RepID=UPI0026ED807F|nr:cytochrome c3 family protein [Malonomonas rubra]